MSTFLTPIERSLKLDRSTLASRLEAIRQYCSTLSFDDQLTWADVMFSGGLSPQALAQLFVEQRGELAPHQALLLAFLQAMDTPERLFNTLPTRHRSYFYREHLKLSERPALPDRVNVSFSLQPTADELMLPAGLLLDAGTDTEGRPRRYQLEQALTANKAKLTDVRWTRRDNDLTRSFVAFDATSAAQWPGEGLTLFEPNAKDQVVESARFIMDERLRLNSGARALRLQFRNPVEGLIAHISAGGKWHELVVKPGEGADIIYLTASESAPPFTGATGLEGVSSDLPVLKLALRGRGPVPNVKGISIRVLNSKAARIRTPDGWFSNSEACYPFGVKPEGQGCFTFVSDEWHGLPSVNVSLIPHWQVKPERALHKDPATAMLAHRLLLTRSSSPSSEHDLFRMYETGLEAQSVVFELKDDDLKPSTVIVDCTLRPSTDHSQRPSEIPPQPAGPLCWQRLQVDWRSEEFVVAQQYLQHPFGYGRQPWEINSSDAMDVLTIADSIKDLTLDIFFFSVLDLLPNYTLSELFARGLEPTSLLLMHIPLDILLLELEHPLTQDQLEQLFLFAPDAVVNQILRPDIVLEDLFHYIRVVQAGKLPFSEQGRKLLLGGIEILLISIDTRFTPNGSENFAGIFESHQNQWTQQLNQYLADVPPAMQSAAARFFRGMIDGLSWQDESLLYEEVQDLQWFLQCLGGENNTNTLYLGLSELKPGQTTTLGWSLTGSIWHSVRWDYLTPMGWQPLELQLDQTAELSSTGLLTYTVPLDAGQSTLMPAGRHWIRARVIASFPGQTTQLLRLETNCASASLVDASTVAAEHFKQLLPCGALTHTVETVPGLASVKQVSPSIGGRGPETPEAFHQRVARELGHRGRAVTWQDIQSLLLEYFIQIRTVKVLDPGRSGTHPPMQIVVVPANGYAHYGDQRRPKFSLPCLKEMGNYLQSLGSPWLQLELINPKYEDVEVRYQVSYAQGIDSQHGATLLRAALERHYMPWIEAGGGEVNLDQELDYYDMVEFIQSQAFVDRMAALTLNGRIESVASSADTVLILQLTEMQAYASQVQANLGVMA